MTCYAVLFVLLIDFNICLANKREVCSAEDIADSNIAEQTYVNYEPSGPNTDVSIINRYTVNSNNDCLKHCCSIDDCDAMTTIRNRCILYACAPKEACKPKRMSGLGPKVLYLVLRSTFNNTDDAKQIQKKDLIDDDTQPCELSVPDNCPENSICKRIIDAKRTGICVCIAGYVKQPSGCFKEHQEDHYVVPVTNSPDSSGPIQPIIEHRIKSIPTSTSVDFGPTQKSTKPKPSPTTMNPSKSSIVAHAGPDRHIYVMNPHASSYSEIVSINGYATNKNGAVVKDGVIFQWTRDMTSLSVGDIVNSSDHRASLMLMNLIQGQYVFTLTVTNKHGATSTDSVSIFVTEKSDDRFGNLVDVLFKTNVYKFSEQESINFSKRMGHIIEKNLACSNCKVHVTSVAGDRDNRTLISFYAETVDQNTKDGQIISAGLIEEKLKLKLTQHKFIFDYPITKLQSRVCYNPCSGHGQCCPYSHRCKCTLPWLNNPWHERSTGFSNCDMHVMIIVVICVASLFMSVLLFLSLKTLFRICNRRRRQSRDILRYKLLDNAES